MISALKDAFQAAETWPEEDQEALVEAAREIEVQRTGVYHATAEALRSTLANEISAWNSLRAVNTGDEAISVILFTAPV
jgi:hypothetical protein